MLYDGDNTRAVVRALKAHYGASTIPPLVCDPVCVSTSGHTLLQSDAVKVMIEELFPLAALITPNSAEAELLLSHGELPSDQSSKVNSLESMLFAARNLLSFGCQGVLLKGGHITANLADVNQLCSAHAEIKVVRDYMLEGNMEILQQHHGIDASESLVVDILQQKDGLTTIFVRPRIDSVNTHGTGCTLSAALACELARGSSRES